MKRLFVLAIVSLLSASVAAQDCVILLHGLGRTENSMEDLEEALSSAGYKTWNESYPSTEFDIPTLAQDHISEGLTACGDSNGIHFVTHSLGGILVRQYLQQNTIDGLGKILMLAPPNHGSEVSDTLKDYKWFQAALGPAAQQLGTGEDSVPNTLKPIPGTIGVIAGNDSSDPWFNWMFSGPTDGKVSVESARLEEMVDFLIVEEGHTFIMNDDEVIRQVKFFLQHGKFDDLIVSEPPKSPASRKPTSFSPE